MAWLWQIEAAYYCSRKETWHRDDVFRLKGIFLESSPGEKVNEEQARLAALSAVRVYSGAGVGSPAPGVYELRITTTKWLNPSVWPLTVTVERSGAMAIATGDLVA